VLLAVIWGAGALVLPWVVRGRSLSFDVVAATTWAAGIAGATGALGEWLGDRVASPVPQGLALGAVVAGAAAVALAHRGGAQAPYLEDAPGQGLPPNG